MSAYDPLPSKYAWSLHSQHGKISAGDLLFRFSPSLGSLDLSSYRMLFTSVLTSAVLALSLGVDTVAASHGRLGQLAREPLERAKRAVDSGHAKPIRSTKDYRFLNDKTKGKYWKKHIRIAF